MLVFIGSAVVVVAAFALQAIRQMYVLVLGLDVLGNPFGVIRGLAEGIESFFYEPYQGFVQGPEEFAEGLVIGFRSLLGHTVGMLYLMGAVYFSI
jgi:vacuolar protein sorting-associated protein 13A/C